MVGKKVVILGAGESGAGAALLARAKGFDVFVSDAGPVKPETQELLTSHQIPFESGQHTDKKILSATEVIKSPGIPDSAPIVQRLRAQNTPVISDIELAARYTDAALIMISGTNGKTTTTLLTYHLLQAAGLNVGLAGNVGISFARQVMENRHDYYVLEISSFQLDTMFAAKAQIAVLLNITPDHLDRYNYKLKNYIQSKFRVVQNMDENGYFIYYADDTNIRDYLYGKTQFHQQIVPVQLPVTLLDHPEDNAAAHLSEEAFVLQIPHHSHISHIPLTSSPLPGRHNKVNAMAAMLIAKALQVHDEVIISGLQSYRNVPHRMEAAGEVKGVRFINDSKATNVDAVFYALEDIPCDGKKPCIIWIAGGIDKGNNYEQLMPLVSHKVKALVCLGIDNTRLFNNFKATVPKLTEAVTMTKAVEKALNMAVPGDVVLLSPACSSFDLFKNYEDRGDQFKAVIQQLMQQQQT